MFSCSTSPDNSVRYKKRKERKESEERRITYLASDFGMAIPSQLRFV